MNKEELWDILSKNKIIHSEMGYIVPFPARPIVCCLCEKEQEKGCLVLSVETIDDVENFTICKNCFIGGK